MAIFDYITSEWYNHSEWAWNLGMKSEFLGMKSELFQLMAFLKKKPNNPMYVPFFSKTDIVLLNPDTGK